VFRKLMIVLIALAVLGLAVGLVGCPPKPQKTAPAPLPRDLPSPTKPVPEEAEEVIEAPEEAPAEEAPAEEAPAEEAPAEAPGE